LQEVLHLDGLMHIFLTHGSAANKSMTSLVLVHL